MSLRELIPWRRKETAKQSEENPFHTLQREVNQVLDRFTRGHGWDELAAGGEPGGEFLPAVDVSETDQNILVAAEIPNLEAKDLEVALNGNTLVIRGEKKAETEEKGKHFYRKESSFGSFYRAIPLPTAVVEGKIEATYNKGVLKVRLPKSPEAQRARKRIAIH